MTIEVGKTKEGLNVLDFVWFRPILDDLDFVGGHSQAVRREHISEVFTGSDVQFAFICTGKKAISAESAEYFPDMLFVLREVVGIDQYVIQIDNDVTAVCIIQGMRLFILKKNKCLVNSISLSILHGMI